MSKVLPYSRSVLFKLLVETADSISRVPAAKGSMGIRVLEGMEYTSGDAVVSDTPAEIPNIQGGIAVISTQNFIVSVTVGGVTGPEQTCSGLFVFSGPLDKVAIKPTGSGTPVRFKYVKA